MVCMEVSTVLDAISLVGFPAVVCIIVMFFVKYLIDKNHEQLNNLTLQHHEEMKEVTKAIENNTIAITKLIEKLN